MKSKHLALLVLWALAFLGIAITENPLLFLGAVVGSFFILIV